MKIGFLTDDKGNPSIARLLSIGSCLVGWAMGIIGMIKNTHNAHTVVICTTFVTVGLGLKWASKKLEK